MTKYVQAGNDNGVTSTVERTELYLDSYKDLGEKIPTQAGLSLFLRVDKDTIRRWSQDIDNKPDFVRLYQFLEAEQEVKLINGSLSNDLNSNIAKMLLTRYGHSDKVVTENTNVNLELENASDEDLNAKIRALQDAASNSTTE